jgi:small nuclear ribonucleoprotein D2
METHTQIMIHCRSDRKLVGRLKAFDRHCNMILEECTEIWHEYPSAAKGEKRAKPIRRERYIPKMFLRGDSVISVLRNPSGGAPQQQQQQQQVKQATTTTTATVAQAVDDD